MALYSKVCMICNRTYMAQRMSSAFCSKRCANKSRKLPQKLRESLYERASRFTLSCLKNEGMYYRPEDYKPEGATKEHPWGKETGYSMALARVEAEKRGIVQNRVAYDQKLPMRGDPVLEKTPVDNEMVDLKLELSENSNNNSTTAQEQPLENKVVEMPKRTGLRRVGEKI